ncbi:MAG TPA: hypothetical protein VMH41_11970 [Mycobacteriales bacterium]|nr:hypothetical protein [Mycobacteriales bacterium]
MSDAELAPDEDAELRRLHKLRGFGMVAGSVSSRYDALRRRDRREKVREPAEHSVASPLERSGRVDRPAKPQPQPKPVESALADLPDVAEDKAEPARLVISDTREILAERRRGFGLFRR